MVMATDMVIMARNQSKRRKGKHRRQKKLWRKRILIGILLCLAAGTAASAFIWSEQKKQNSLQVTAGNAHDVGSDYRNILYKGEKYQYNNRVTTISMQVWIQPERWNQACSTAIKPGQIQSHW